MTQMRLENGDLVESGVPAEWERRFYAMVANAAEAISIRMRREPFVRLELCYYPAENGRWGGVAAVASDDALPRGWLPVGITIDGSVPYADIGTRILPHLRRLPLIGTD